MADLAKTLERIHELELEILCDQLEAIKARMDAGDALVDMEGKAIDVLEKIRAVEIALKRNSISAAVDGRGRAGDLSSLARKLNFKGMNEKRKVVPIRPEAESA